MRIKGNHVSSGLPHSGLSEQSTIAGNHDPLQLFACHLEGLCSRKPGAYQALVDASDDDANSIREIAELLLHPGAPVR
jgi:hypothetical protein